MIRNMFLRVCEVRELRDRVVGITIQRDQLLRSNARLTHTLDETASDLRLLIDTLSDHTHVGPWGTRCPVCDVLAHHRRLS